VIMAPVLVAKLDRLSRDVHFISGLMVHKVPSLWRSLALMPIPSCCICTPPSGERAQAADL
jgi:hypothetical protein